jgi:flagellar basal body-associated protein FliL
LESKGTFFILIIVVAILTLTLAALAGYLFLVQGAPQAKVDAKTSAEAKVIPKEADLSVIPLYDGKRYFNLNNDDPKKIAIIQVNISLKCMKQFKEEKKAVTAEEKITSYSQEIQELIVRFFLQITIENVKDPAIFDKAKEDLKKQINTLLNEGQKEPQDIVYKVIFSEWLFQ